MRIRPIVRYVKAWGGYVVKIISKINITIFLIMLTFAGCGFITVTVITDIGDSTKDDLTSKDTTKGELSIKPP